ncbi:DUF1329 domain-containing protein [Zavarzinia compransoris]|uniref:DUF1329 domain-containing protein n=1 Tax=Zavarzinia compransoris TaxID=1264899 RepID=A0A317DW29_9PROT|nr:DUF1329 domain-containing protein [Zavarzinia compransoris]PWR18076.1 DUF1329 domain-containing protein [Zavarzinia compransoris]TDP43450.1 uncharacterized protein DUF1329 [Zavarzinia compransoris]
MKTILALAVTSLLAAGTAAAAGDPDRLGADLTPMGAIKAGNADGSIPAWSGGITVPPAGYRKGGPLADPFAGEKPVATVTGANLAAYEALLPAGQVAMLKRFPTYRVEVYPSHRSCSATPAVYDGTKRNATQARLTANGKGLADGTLGIPFPMAANGLEMFWNHRLRPRGGFMFRRFFALAAVSSTGDYRLTKLRDEGVNHLMGPGRRAPGDVTGLAGLGNIWITYMAVTTAPARLSGQITLVYDNIDDDVGPRQAWQYNPGTRRVLRAPELAFDAPGTNADGLATIDQFDMMNGSPERYDFKHLGDREAIIGYNAYQAKLMPYKELLTKGHINPAALRYEKHRVHVVEASLKEGARHIYARRTFFQDEDSWGFVAATLYDTRGNLWRFQEAPVVNAYDVPFCGPALEISHDLQADRYLASQMTNEEKMPDWDAKLNPDDFTPDALRALGTR